MAEAIRSVGFIGLGDMGAKQALELAKLSLPLTVYDVRREAMAPFEGKATLADAMADVGASDLVGICVQNDAQVTGCVEVLLPVMRRGSVILVHSTVRPETVRSLSAQADAAGIALHDAPVTRTRMVSDGPFVFCPIGGDAALVERVRSVVEAFATNIVLAGPIGAGVAMKICSNLISWCEVVAVLEALSLAEAAGIEPDALLELTRENGLLTPPMRIFAEFKRNPLAEGPWAARVRTAGGQALHDLTLATELAAASVCDTPLASKAQSLVGRTIDAIFVS